MADTYWKTCPKAKGKWLPGGGGGVWSWECRCEGKPHGRGRMDEVPLGLVPVKGALLIEDREAAVGQMVAADEETYDMMMGYTPEGKRLRMGVYLRAAAGEGEE